ncbi:MAG: hypothetical protein HZB67_01985 [Candidatus Aenigmarchaeota archaeon]|nr:hypothetical protein [Candidatus Aenigmarchaeota archaeon]
MKRKGQGALEYLMTYGWALLIIVVVAAALYALGVLNPATYASSQCRGFTYFTWQSQKLTAGGGYETQIQNGNQNVEITGIKIGTMAASATPTTLTVGGVSKLNQNITSGSIIVVSTSSDVTDKTKGDTFSGYQLEITYNIDGGIQGKTDIASCTGKVE